MPDRGPDYFFDTVSLCNFALAKSLDLLVSRYGLRARITQEVLDEVTDGVVAGHAGLRAIEDAVADARFSRAPSPTSPDERESYRQMLRILAPGEASCIACAKARGGIVVTDDKTARECCTERGVKFTGTIGILKACSQTGSLTPEAADAILQTMIAAGYYSPIQRISDLA